MPAGSDIRPRPPLGRAETLAGLVLGSVALVAVSIAALTQARAAPPAPVTRARAPVAAAPAATRAGVAAAAGFWSGTDSTYISIPGPAPYREPAVGGSYGGYIGMIGNWAAWQHCPGDRVVWSSADAKDARANLTTYHRGIGTGAYWFMAGPGVDPHYNGTVAEATDWGKDQAAAALADLRRLSPKVTYPVLFLDVELPGIAPGYSPAQDNGWDAVYTSACSGIVKRDYVSAQLDRADFNGFANYLTSHSSYLAGVYSAPEVWESIFGAGSYAVLTNTYEWTYTADTSSLSHRPSRWCLAGTRTCAQFFGGITSASKYALMWQWSGGGGTDNGYGDLDQIDSSRTP